MFLSTSSFCLLISESKKKRKKEKEFIKNNFYVVTSCGNKKIHKEGNPPRNWVLFRLSIRLMLSEHALISKSNPRAANAYSLNSQPLEVITHLFDL